MWNLLQSLGWGTAVLVVLAVGLFAIFGPPILELLEMGPDEEDEA